MTTPAFTDAELAAWLRLSLAEGLRPVALRALLDAFGSPESILAQTLPALAMHVGEHAARCALAPAFPDFPMQLEALRMWRAQAGHHLLTLRDPAYPQLLLTMPDPPPLLYVQGRLALLQKTGIAIVGSRSATPQGLDDAKRFAHMLGRAGVTVVSGLALGIDGAAHLGALHTRGGTVAVIGTGADVIYPSAHDALARQLADDGAIVSEWPLGTPPRAANFPQRNRLIAGMSRGVLLIEAAMRSGSLITARLANDMGRDVFALPGSIHAPLSRGCHRMIKQGARLVETPDEVLDELGWKSPQHRLFADDDRDETYDGHADTRPPSYQETAVDPHDQTVLDALGHSPVTLEILAGRTDMADTTLQSTLLRLELAGHLSALPGGRFVRTTRTLPDQPAA